MGLQYDRAWALVDASGKALTQKQYPRLALVQPAISLQDRMLLVRAPGMAEDLVIPLEDDGSVTACDGSLAIPACVFRMNNRFVLRRIVCFCQMLGQTGQ
jgi:hypothetical protein